MLLAEYVPVGQATVDRLVRCVQLGDSALIVGSYYGGKTYLLSRLRDALLGERLNPVFLQFFSAQPVESAAAFREELRRALGEAGYVLPSIPDGPELLTQLLATVEAPDRCILLISSLDGLGHLLRPFVAEVLRASVDKRLIVVMTGEIDALALVSGTNSPIREGRLFVVQGLDRSEFDHLLDSCASDLGLVFAPGNVARDHIWSVTGGSMPLTMRFVRELSFYFPGSRGKVITLADVKKQTETEIVRGIHRAPAFRRAADLIDGDPTCWAAVQSLINTGSAGIGGSLPCTLEMTGLAVRENRSLRCHSPLIAEFLRTHYDSIRFGDLYASHGEWNDALSYYKSAATSQLTRRRETNDLSRLHSVVNAVCAQMYDVFGHGRQPDEERLEQARCLNSLRQLLTDACTCILGFDQVTFWTSSSGTWSLNLLEGTPTVVAQDLEILVGRFAGQSVTEVTECSGTEMLVTLMGLRPGQRFGALISATQGQYSVLWTERRRFLRQVLRNFVKAHDYVVSMMRKQLRRDLDSGLARSIDAVLREVSGSLAAEGQAGVDQLARTVARAWNELAFSRVMIFLTNADLTRLQPVCEFTDSSTAMLSPYWEVSLDGLNEGFLRQAYGEAQPLTSERPEEDLRLPERVRKIISGPLSAIPMLNCRHRSIGVIVVERRDRSVSTNSELQDLMFFAGQLGAAIEQTERISSLQFSLDAIPEATLILDQTLRTEYVSAPAAQLFRIKAGWRDQDLRTDEVRELPSLEDVAKRSLYVGSAMRYDEELGLEKWAAETIATRILDRRGQTVGTLLHIRNYSSLRRAINALGKIAESDDIKQARSLLLSAAQELGFAWGRLYVPWSEQPDRLIAEAAFGVSDELAEKIRTGAIVLPPRRTPGNESWICIERRETLIFCYRPEYPYGTIRQTKYGLEYITVQEPQARDELEKKAGEYWIDFPLHSMTELIGKVTLACDDNLLPEEFRLLRQLADLYPRVFDSIAAKERTAVTRADHIRTDAAQKTINAVAHTLKNVLAPLSNVHGQYKKLEATMPELVSLDEKLAGRLATARATIDRVYRAFGPLRPRDDEDFDLIKAVRLHLDAKQSDATCEVVSDVQTLDVRADRHSLEAALDELVQNSIDAMPSNIPPAIRITIGIFQKNLREYVRIIYRDHGPGIPYHFKASLFKELQTHAHRGARRQDGTGIGLSVVRRIIEEHGGFIHEIGKPGEGVEFIVELPRYPVVA